MSFLNLLADEMVGVSDAMLDPASKAHEIVLQKDGYIDVKRTWRPLSVSEPPPTFDAMKPLGGQIEVKTKKKRGN